MKALTTLARTLASTARDFAAVIILTVLCIGAIHLLSLPQVTESSIGGVAAQLLVTAVSFVFRFGLVCAAAWIGLSWTLPEAGKAIFSPAFTDWWDHLDRETRMRFSLIAAGVLFVAAGMAMPG